MNYKFPCITNISDVLPAIEGRDEFTVAIKEGYTVINYNVIMTDTFPDVIVDADPYDQASGVYEQRDYNAAVRRECRGIIFDTATGEIIRRPFHKFFNVNEREETQEHIVDLSDSHAILDKLDGSMIAPFIVDGKMIWGTKMGATDVAKPVEEFVKNNPQYVDFAIEAINDGWTPIFEWCSRKQRIVLDYGNEDQLILTAVRNIKTGAYVNHEMLSRMGHAWDFPVVKSFDSQTDMKMFISHIRGLEDVEGFVVRFDDGHMIKLKCDWYVQIHKAKEAILQDRNIVEIILDEKLDDIKAHLPAEDRDRLTQFENDFNRELNEVVNCIFTEIVDISQREIDRKTFAINWAPNLNPFVRPIIFALWDVDPIGRDEIRAKVINTIRNNIGRTTKWEELRHHWFKGVTYNASAN